MHSGNHGPCLLSSGVLDRPRFPPAPRPRPSPSRHQLPETIRRPSGLKATLVTRIVCPLSVSVSWPVAASQTFTVLSSLPETIRRPSGLKATL